MYISQQTKEPINSIMAQHRYYEKKKITQNDMAQQRYYTEEKKILLRSIVGV